MDGACSGVTKSSWPELVGVPGEAAGAIISKQNPRLRVAIMEEGTPVTLDFRCDRVRVWVDKFDIVTLVPRVG